MSGIKLTAQDRVAIIAPHPDDESLATGGLLQRAVAAGSVIRIFFITDGDNNPWPQRVVERKWRIRGEDRRRWGERRRAEAIAALDQLGVPADAARFFGFPDQGLTESLIRQEPKITRQIVKSLEDFDPTHVLFPAEFDLHPDHNAMHVLTRLALDRLSPDRAIREYCYIVHSRGRHSKENRLSLQLRPGEKAIKREAILAHGSQMILSRKRFLDYAKEVETFYKPARPSRDESHHPIESAEISNGALRLKVRLSSIPAAARSGASLLVAIEKSNERGARWRVPLRGRSGRTHIRDAVTGEMLRMATVRIHGMTAEFNLPVSAFLPLCRVFVKVETRRIFLDVAGWRQVPVKPPPGPFDSEKPASGLRAAAAKRHGNQGREPALSAGFLARVFSLPFFLSR